MTKDEVIERMKEAGLKAPARGDFIFIHWDQIALLLGHERAAEREACAKVCEAQVETGAHLRCAAAIRARSKE